MIYDYDLDSQKYLPNLKPTKVEDLKYGDIVFFRKKFHEIDDTSAVFINYNTAKLYKDNDKKIKPQHLKHWLIFTKFSVNNIPAGTIFYKKVKPKKKERPNVHLQYNLFT